VVRRDLAGGTLNRLVDQAAPTLGTTLTAEPPEVVFVAAAPDPELLVGGERESQAASTHGACGAYSFGFCHGVGRIATTTDRKEQPGVHALAGCPFPPGPSVPTGAVVEATECFLLDVKLARHHDPSCPISLSRSRLSL
jgi:hypothetical protein